MASLDQNRAGRSSFPWGGGRQKLKEMHARTFRTSRKQRLGDGWHGASQVSGDKSRICSVLIAGHKELVVKKLGRN